MKISQLLTHSLLIASTTALYAKEPATKAPVNDIKPALSNDNIDEEEMRITKLIHKRIIAKQTLEKKATPTPPQAYSEKVSDEQSISLLPIKAGSFIWQGEQADDSVKVSLSAFWMGKHEITWGQYRPFMFTKIPRLRNGHIEGFIREKSTNDMDFIARPTPQYYPLSAGMPTDDPLPMLSMTQHAANKYCQWLSYKTGHFYRLPTEAEWEYACRAGSKTKYSWGDDPAEGNKYAWFGGNDKSIYNKPGLKQPNAWGLYDMHGNMQEWTLDQYVPNRKKFFGKGNVLNPWVKATKPYPHVIKGGHWMSPPTQLTAATRQQSKPEWKIKDPQGTKSIWFHTSAQTVGFRIVRPAKIPTAEEMYHYWNSHVEYDGDYAVYE